jgi:ribosomal protein L31E
MIFDAVLTYNFIKQLTTPFIQMPAYKMGLINANGDFLKARAQMTTQEKSALGIFNVMIINLKKIIAKIPGGGSRLGTIAATMILLNTKPIKEDVNFEYEQLEEEFNKIYSMLQEDGAAGAVAVNNAGGGDIAGLGQPVGSLKGFPPVSNYAMNKYKKKNKAAAGPILADILKRKAMTEDDTFAKNNHEVFANDYVSKNKKQINLIKKFVKSTKKVTEATTLQYHDTLNTKIWDNGQLKAEVRGKLLQIAEAWRQFAKIQTGEIVDIIFTGGNANYNYTDNSDIDLHLIIDRSNFGGNPLDIAFVDEYLQDKKILWTLTHPSINIYGYPVELYAQDVNDQPHFGQGVYSIMYDSWVQMPENLNLNFEKDHHLQRKVTFYKNMIDKLVNQKADKETIDTLKDRIKSMRGDSIKQGGEFSFGNLVFKELRNQGYLDKLSDYEKTSQDSALSLG